MKPKSCLGCVHYLGGGCCRINLEAECAAGYFEMYEAKEPKEGGEDEAQHESGNREDI
ncbi:MAG: hypothetical protein PHS57_05925 [Alphaproteobacteria bacterium]|nr:hypothetical protein [Alphaproteobacteria bacterium]